MDDFVSKYAYTEPISNACIIACLSMSKINLDVVEMLRNHSLFNLIPTDFEKDGGVDVIWQSSIGLYLAKDFASIFETAYKKVSNRYLNLLGNGLFQKRLVDALESELNLTACQKQNKKQFKQVAAPDPKAVFLKLITKDLNEDYAIMCERTVDAIINNALAPQHPYIYMPDGKDGRFVYEFFRTHFPQKVSNDDASYFMLIFRPAFVRLEKYLRRSILEEFLYESLYSAYNAKRKKLEKSLEKFLTKADQSILDWSNEDKTVQPSAFRHIPLGDFLDLDQDAYERALSILYDYLQDPRTGLKALFASTTPKSNIYDIWQRNFFFIEWLLDGITATRDLTLPHDTNSLRKDNEGAIVIAYPGQMPKAFIYCIQILARHRGYEFEDGSLIYANLLNPNEVLDLGRMVNELTYEKHLNPSNGVELGLPAAHHG